MGTLQSINPYNNQLIATYHKDSSESINEKIAKAYHTQKEWATLRINQRANILIRLSELLNQNKMALAEMAALEMGKPIKQGIAEVEKCARTLLYYAENGESFLMPIAIPTEAQKSYISYQPLGTILAIMPWNFPFWQVYRALSAIMISGNTFVLKHASNVTGCAQLMKKIWDEIGEYQDAFQILLVSGSDMENIIANPQIAAVTLTGSTPAGSQVAATAGKYLKKQVLELGGSDAYIIMKDANIELAAEKLSTSRLNNSGQSCIAAKRFLVDESIKDKLVNQLKVIFENKKFGNPLDENNHVGTIARQDLRDELHQQVLKSVALGATIVCGGYIPEGDNALYPPTILTNVTAGMPAYEEELFGPVASVITYQDINEAIEIANSSIFGLGGGIFSTNIALAEKIANEELHTGFVAINDFVSSDPRLPFGGIKQSGYGRELSHLGVHEFCNAKTIYIR